VEIVSELTSEFSEKYIKLVVLGGDGTMNEVLQGVADFNHTYIAYIPTGSSNDLARDLKITGEPLEILKQILKAKKPVPIDMGVLTYNSMNKERSRLHNKHIKNTRYFNVSCGIGFDAAICEEALASKTKNFFNKIGLGKLTYGTIAIKQLFTATKSGCKLYLDDNPPIYIKRLWLMAIMVHSYQGGGIMFCPGADYRDGYFDICVGGDISTLKTLTILPRTFKGKHVGCKGVNIYKAKNVRVKTEVPLWVHTDGEVSVQSNDIELTCRKQIINILNPIPPSASATKLN
jgi:YegS/Rv2252/BmrU family lipid kinase